MKRAATHGFLGAATAALVTASLASPAAANPVMSCFVDHIAVVGEQGVELTIEVDAAESPSTIEVYRVPAGGMPDPEDPNAVLVGQLPSEGTPSQSDTGSGVVTTEIFSFQETCVPQGEWQYVTNAYCESGQVTVSGTDSACATTETTEDDGGSGCGVASDNRGATGWMLVGLGALALAWRRRS
jgi:MYXO-CTERM domain-containing protein